MGASVATFTNVFTEIEYIINDREIYNDIKCILRVGNTDYLIQSIDPLSCKKYGRRTKRLATPIGATLETVQNLCNEYLDKHAEPVSILNVEMVGDTDALKAELLTRKISEKVTIIQTGMGLNADYWINSVKTKYSTKEMILEAYWELEGVRTGE